MNLRALVLALVLLVFAAGPREVWGEPNHLEPMDPLDYRLDIHDGYHGLVFEELVGRTQTECWMISRPSFRAEYAVMLRREETDPKPNDPFAANKKYRWFLETAVATLPIWHWNEPPNGQGKLELNLRKDVNVDRKKIEITEAFGRSILDTWTSVLRLTRYTQESYMGLDGVNYDFCSQGHYGTIWTPHKGIPADLVSLAHQLKSLAETEPSKRLGVQEEAWKTARNLRERAEKEAKKLQAID